MLADFAQILKGRLSFRIVTAVSKTGSFSEARHETNYEFSRRGAISSNAEQMGRSLAVTFELTGLADQRE